MKIFFCVLVLLIIPLEFFSYYEIYDYLFMKPKNYLEYNSNSSGEFGIEFYSIKKYPLMDSNELLSSVWSQQRDLIGGQMVVESSNYTHAISSSKAVGLLQLKPQTAEDLYVYNLFDPYDNLKGALEYHGYLRRLFNNERLQIIAYHDGPTAVMAGRTSENGEKYYEKVKGAQNNYQNRKIYSPYFVGGRFLYSKEDEINTELMGGLAYRKYEIYGGLSFKTPPIQDQIQDQSFSFDSLEIDYNYSFLYSPRTHFGLGFEGEILPTDLLLRIGLPWQNFILKGPNNPEIIYKHSLNNNWTTKLMINEEILLISGYFSIDFLDLYLGYNIFEHSINLGFRISF